MTEFWGVVVVSLFHWIWLARYFVDIVNADAWCISASPSTATIITVQTLHQQNFLVGWG